MAIPFTDFEDQFNRAVLQNISFRIFISQSVIIFFDDICALFHVLIYFQCYQIKPYENFSNKILISVWLCCCYVPLYKSASFKKFSSPVGNYMLKCNNRNTRTRCEICSKLTIKTPERRHWRRSGVFIVNFEDISHLALLFLLLTLSR